MLQDRIVDLNELARLLGDSSPKITLAHDAGVINSLFSIQPLGIGINRNNENDIQRVAIF